ncbi:MAG TPA: ABC transporter permease [Verrucomicrobiae bacterium]|nr:ABC transporter permease [Verrucomicrobiae bacterium]
MTVADATRIAFHALGRNKLRSALTALGIVIGVGSLIALLGIGHGARVQVEKQVASLGENVIQIQPGTITKNAVKLGSDSVSGLTVEDAEAIKREVPDVVAVSPEVKTKSQVVTGNRNWRTSVYGISADYFTIRQWKTVKGEIFSEQDEPGAAKVTVIGSAVAEELFGEDDPVDKIIRIQNVPVTVIGVLKPKGASAEGYNQDDNIFVPYGMAVRNLVGKQTSLRKIYVQATSLEAMVKVERQITQLLLQRHGRGMNGIEDAKPDDFFKVTTQLEIAESATATARTMTLLLGLIASVSLVVGGIGIMNIMLVSVTERTREIGVRIAIGAHRRHILCQFLIEAVTLSALGGIIGIALGTGAAKLLTALAGWPTLISPDAVLVAFMFSAVVGIFFGFYPARKASRLDPIEALRYE